jgi:hypothetical protein
MQGMGMGIGGGRGGRQQALFPVQVMMPVGPQGAWQPVQYMMTAQQVPLQPYLALARSCPLTKQPIKQRRRINSTILCSTALVPTLAQLRPKRASPALSRYSHTSVPYQTNHIHDSPLPDHPTSTSFISQKCSHDIVTSLWRFF